mmetsp:Transcript_23927/g.36860  ORF Transcript_23927/g.36860 Transcript_23927/m.36860 type:complete len:248 (+) Transcript_23927:1285-2028(+)
MGTRMKSRRLWQKALAPNAPRSAMLKAILYEIQPVRISTLRNGPAWVKEQASSAHGIYREIADEVKILLNHEDLKDYMREKTIKWKQHMPWFAIFMMYAWAVWTVHKWLDAGPMMVIVTLLVMIFTVGLGDRKGDGVMSAYSVFNRGFQRLLGTVDAEDLVAEQVGGVMAAQARANNPQQQQQQQAAEPGQQQQQPPKYPSQTNTLSDHVILHFTSRSSQLHHHTRRSFSMATLFLGCSRHYEGRSC